MERVRVVLFECVVTVSGCVIGTSAPTENMLCVRVCKVDVDETCGMVGWEL